MCSGPLSFLACSEQLYDIWTTFVPFVVILLSTSSLSQAPMGMMHRAMLV